MVAASATAILIDINLSTRPPQTGALKCYENPVKTPACRLAHAFLTACLNRTVSTPAASLVSMRATKEMFELK